MKKNYVVEVKRTMTFKGELTLAGAYNEEELFSSQELSDWEIECERSIQWTKDVDGCHIVTLDDICWGFDNGVVLYEELEKELEIDDEINEEDDIECTTYVFHNGVEMELSVDVELDMSNFELNEDGEIDEYDIEMALEEKAFEIIRDNMILPEDGVVEDDLYLQRYAVE